jgi:signal peptidase II
VSAAWPRAGLVVLAVLVVDQASKALARGAVDRGAEDPILPGLKLVNVRNDGVAFGIDPGGTTRLVSLVALALLALLLYFVRHSARPLIWLPVGLLIGGALGNIADRIREGAVTDFLKLPSWPAFNLADVSITVGVIVLIFVMERGEKEEEEPAREPVADAGAADRS